MGIPNFRSHIPEVETMQEAKETPHTFRVQLKRRVYYDNDSIEGTLTCTSKDSSSPGDVSIALVCRFVCKDLASPLFKSAHTVYRYVCTLGNVFSLYNNKHSHSGI